MERGLYHNDNGEIVFCGYRKQVDPDGLIWVTGHEKYWPEKLIENNNFTMLFVNGEIVQSLICTIESKCKKVDLEKVKKYNQNMEYIGAFFQVDLQSQSLIQYRASYANASVLDPVEFPWSDLYKTWRDADNNDMVFTTPQDFLLFSKAISDHCFTIARQCMTHKDNLRAMKNDGSTCDDVMNYDITTGW